MSNKEFVLSVFDKNTPSNLVVENILSRTGLDGEEPFAEENRARLEVACAKQIPWIVDTNWKVRRILIEKSSIHNWLQNYYKFKIFIYLVSFFVFP